MSSFFNRRKNARGAIAVIVAFACTTFFVLAAIGVDLGNAMGRKKQVQSSADFSALAAGASLPVTGSPAAGDAAVLAAVDYLNKDQPIDDGKTCDQSKTCVTAAQLVNGNFADGEVQYLSSTTLRVTAPANKINFSIAQVIGAKSTNVNAQATVSIFSPGTGVMPVYAVTGCDWGTQVLTDPANGQAATNVPPLEFPTDNGVADVTTLTPNSVAVGATGQFLSIAGSKLDGGAAARAQFTQVGFFRSTSSAAPTSIVGIVPTAPPTDNFLSIAIPSSVTAIEDVWWVRVRTQNNQGTNEWSPMSEALPFRVGQAVLECAGSSNDGNFGSLLLPRVDVANNNNNIWLAANMAVGLQMPMTLHTYAGSIPGNGQCAPGPGTSNAPYVQGPGDNQTRYSPSGSASTTADLIDRTNCVDTDSGLPANAATAGMITGLGAGSVAPLGRLRDKPTTCGPGSGNQSRTVQLNNVNYTINNDMLTCYFLDNTVRVADVSVPTYTYNGGAKSVSDKIYSSPRFFYVPVLQVEPSSGGCCHYFIKDFRPAFLTGNPSTATKQSPGVTPSDDNGLLISQNDVRSMRVVFLNQAAIVVPETGPVTPYLGSGDKLVRLVN